jgi:Uma2 family endonuclease
MKEEILLDLSDPEIEPFTDYETERGKPMPNIIHGTIQTQISFLLKTVYGDQFIFPNETALATEPSTTPDICIYAKRKLDVREVESRETEMPLTTIEILSPSQTIDYLQSKVWDIYFPAGVGSAWIVVPQLKSIQLLTRDGEEVFYKTELTDPITGIKINVEKVFEDLA